MPGSPARTHPDPILFDDFGCPACRHAFGPAHYGTRAIPDVLVSIQKRLGRPLPDWTSAFYACRECDAIWVLWLEPKEETYKQFTTPLGTSRALLSEGELEHILILVFSWFPVQQHAENALWQLRYSPGYLWDILVMYWHQAEGDHAKRARIIGLMAGLLQQRNPHHRELPVNAGRLISDLRGFDSILEGLFQAWLRHRDAAVVDGDPAAPDSAQDVDDDQAMALFADRSLETLISIERRLTALELWPEPLSDFSGARSRPRDEVLMPDRTGVTETVHRTGMVTGLPGPWERSLQLLMPFWRFLPAILAGWLLVERVAGNAAATSRLVASLFFFSGALVLDGAAVAANAGISEAPMRRIIWHRLSVIGDYLLFGILAGVVTFGYVAAAASLGADTEGLSSGLHAYVIVLLFAMLNARLWPFWIIPYMQPVERDIVTPRAPGITRHPALSTAWKLTRRPGTFRRFTLPWFGCVAAGIVLTLIADRLWGGMGRSLVLYPLVMPWLTAMTWAMTEALLDQDITTPWE